MEIKFSIQLTSAFNDEQKVLRRKEYLGQPIIRLRRYVWNTSKEGSLRRKTKKIKALLGMLAKLPWEGEICQAQWMENMEECMLNMYH